MAWGASVGSVFWKEENEDANALANVRHGITVENRYDVPRPAMSQEKSDFVILGRNGMG